MSIKWSVAVSAFTLSTLTFLIHSPNAQAYDEDTHFYATYSMARYAGIRQEVAAKIALCAQWMDESYISDPTSMILLPVDGVKKRRLLHFPSWRFGTKMKAFDQKAVWGLQDPPAFLKKIGERIQTDFNVDVSTMDIDTETTEDNNYASQMMFEGMTSGNLMLAAASIHTLEDSFAHAGTPAETGHKDFWHWPDRPFADVPKYFRMTKTVFKALVGIRSLLPAQALDCNIKLVGPTPNCQMEAAQLAESYNSNTVVTSELAIDVLSDPEYVAVAIDKFLRDSVASGFMNLNERQIRAVVAALPNNGWDSYRTAFHILNGMTLDYMKNRSSALNIRKLLIESKQLQVRTDANGKPLPISDQEIFDFAKSQGFTFLTKTFATYLLRTEVPRPLDGEHKIETEDDSSPARAKELDLRVRNMKDVIVQLFGEHINMIPNSTKDAAGFMREVLLDPAVETKFPKQPGVINVSFTLAERNAWDQMIFRYLYPSLPADTLTQLVTRVHAADVLTEGGTKFLGFTRAPRLAWMAYEAYSFFRPLVHDYLESLIATHEFADERNKYYRIPRLFQQEVSGGLIHPFLGESDIWHLDILKRN